MPVTEASTEARTAVPATEEVTEKKTETPATEKATEKKTEAATEKKTTAPASEAVAVDYGIGWIEGNYMGTDPNLEGAQPTISINGNGHMDMTLNFGEGFNSYKCTYETSGKKNEMDILISQFKFFSDFISRQIIKNGHQKQQKRFQLTSNCSLASFSSLCSISI